MVEVNAILAQTLWLLGLLGLVVSAIAGIWLVAAPRQALGLAGRLNREYSIHWLQNALDTPRATEPFIYRHHKVFGPLLIAGTGYFFWGFFTAFDEQAIVSLYAGLLPTTVLEILAAVLVAVLVVGNALGALLGFVVLLRPSALKGAEGWANRWIASDSISSALDRRIDRPEGFAQRYPRRVGVAILLAAAYITVIALAVG